ncbi:MAG: ATP-binding protein [Thermodesulfovibrionales bacterium]|jgi:two-component system nitrogen regulation sensor histidine kinase NtrY
MKKLSLILFGLFLFIIGASALEFHFIRLVSISITTRGLLLILFNVNIIALLTLMFFVGKNLAKLYIERKQKVLGSQFKTKIVAIFVILTSIPSVLLFLGASGLVIKYIDRWFTPQFREPIDSTMSIASSIYETQRRKTLEAARTIIAQGSLPMEYTVIHLTELPDNPSEVIKEAFEGKEGTEVVSSDDGDTVRAVVPDVLGSKGILIVESRVPADITRNVEKIKSAYEDYIKLEAWKQPLQLNVLLSLGFLTLLVIFMALWVSLRLSRGITEPIQSLAQATGEVAAGNLDVSISVEREDEIGLLINSFNHMVKELKEGKESLQEAYSESNRRRLSMETILENIQSGVISLDADGKSTTINRAACAILNVEPEDVIGKNYREILSGIKSDSLQELIRGITMKSLGSVEKEVWASIKGKRTLLRVSIMGLRDATSHYLGILVVFDDLTDVIKAQRALAWQEVARRIAHEIKNPLTPIKLSTERMLKKWEQKDKDFGHVFERSTKTIIREVDSLRGLVDEFSRFGKMPEIIKSPTSIAGIIDEVVNLYRDYKDFAITVTIPAHTPLIDMDGEQFKRVLINLFDNAIHAMDRNGNIFVTVRIDSAANKVGIDVADDGPGIREEDKERLFLPYFSTKDGGTGLGLAIASRIIAEHRGYLRVGDNEPRGTVFTIEIPIKEG